jgi:hypothetical protein
VNAQRVVAELALAFPASDVTPDTVRLYVRALSDVPLDQLEVAVQELIATRTSAFLPTVAEIRLVAVRRALGAPSEVEALEQVIEYLADQGHPPHRCVHRALHAVGGAYAWRVSENPSVLRGQFLAAYRGVVVAETQQASVRGIEVISQATLEMAMREVTP